jgi:hypothetical protein
MFRKMKVSANLFLVAGLIALSTTMASAQQEPADKPPMPEETPSVEDTSDDGEVITEEMQAADGGALYAQDEVEVSPAAVQAFDVTTWRVQNNLGVGTDVPAYRIDAIRNSNGGARIRVNNPNTGNAAFADLYISSGATSSTSNGFAIQRFGTNYSASSWSGIPLARWARMRTDTNTLGLIITTGGTDPIIFGTKDAERVRISSGGLVGIGTNSPTHRLTVNNASTEDVLRLTGPDTLGSGARINFGDGDFVYIEEDLDDYLTVYASNRTAIMGGNVGIGTTSPAFKLDVNGNSRTTTLQITGGADLAESFEVNGAQPVEPGMVVAIDAENPGQLRIADRAYDRTVAGVVSGAGGVQPGLTLQQEGTLAIGSHPVSLTGRVYVLADASYGAISPGDLLTTSDTRGYAMRVSEYEQAQGAILGKAMTSLEQDKGLVLVLVTLQ